MNRGSRDFDEGRPIRPCSFNEAPIHESGKCHEVLAVATDSYALQ